MYLIAYKYTCISSTLPEDLWGLKKYKAKPLNLLLV